LATFWINVLSGSASPELLNAAGSWACDALLSPSRIRAINAFRARLIPVMPSQAPAARANDAASKQLQPSLSKPYATLAEQIGHRAQAYRCERHSGKRRARMCSKRLELIIVYINQRDEMAKVDEPSWAKN
jgi:hypothetical protein